MAESAAKDRPLSCQSCGKSFGRSEHLKRHILTHTRSREFQCRVCKKAFFRKDALSRHEHTHQAPGPNLLQRGGRACIPCASSKTRCSGQATCTRCQQRSLQCTYPEASVNDDDPTQPQAQSPRLSQDTIVMGNRDESAKSLDHVSRQTTCTERQTLQNLSYDMAPVTHPISTLSQMELTTTQFEDTAQMMIDSTDHYQEVQNTTNLYSALPSNYSTINWLGFEDQTSLIGLDQEWQDPDHLFNFYVPASDTHSISQISPAASRDLEAIVSGATTNPSYNTTATPQDAGTTSTLGTDETPTTPGQFYADGGTARLPRMRKRRAMSSYATHEHSRKRFSMALPADLTHQPSNDGWIDVQGHAELQSHYANMCTSVTMIFEPFEDVEFPQRVVIDHLCDLYIENCTPILPFLHTPTLRTQKQHSLLIVAMAAMGSHHLKNQQANRFVLSMHEFVRRILFFATESTDAFRMDRLTYYRLLLLHAVAATYCGNERLREQALSLKPTLVAFFLEGNSAQMTGVQIEGSWYQWIERESYIRLRYCIWLLDCMWSCQLQTRTVLSLSDATIPMPANEELWNAVTEAQWTPLMQSHERTLDLASAVGELYAHKRVKADTGEFARILLIYGLHRRLSEVAMYHGQKLSHWAPGDSTRPQTYTIPDLPIWLPSLPVFRLWQNLTCDSLDVLHWAANATIGEASGFEHPTVLHLHLARVLLLTPIREIVNLARYLAGEKGAKSEDGVLVDRQAVHRWALQHQYKARLAAIHAGVVFWHVRRFSANSFYEPTAVAHAALVLWAFSAFSSKTAAAPVLSADEVRQSSVGTTNYEAGDDSADSESSSDTIILLDRPADDEIVQEFVLNGPRMRANMTGVGDLYGEKGPERVVREGAKILKSLGCWRVWESWAKILDKLVVVCKRERKRIRNVASLDNHAMSVSSTRDITRE